MCLEYDLFMKLADVSLDIVLSISNPSNALKKRVTETDTRVQSQITCELLVNSLAHIKSGSETPSPDFGSSKNTGAREEMFITGYWLK